MELADTIEGLVYSAMEITLHHKDQPDVLDSVSSFTGLFASYV